MRPRTAVETAVGAALRGRGDLRPGETLVVGLSGGADSVALTQALAGLAAERGFRLVAAHLDHGLRRGSAADARFCRRLCRRLGVRLRVATADVRGRARRDRGGLEEAARAERYEFLRAVKEREGARAVAVAHTLDDQAETLLLRLLRGGGSAGLSAMRPRAGEVWRPLLTVTRTQVLEHLRARGLTWREDPTNADPSMMRNRVRAELLPYLESRFNPGVRQALARTAALLADEADYLEARAQELARDAVRPEGLGVVVSRVALAGAPRPLARLALRQALAAAGGLRGVAFAHVERLLDVMGSVAPSGRRLPLPGGREAVFRFDEVWLGPVRRPAERLEVPLTVPGRVRLPGGRVLVARAARGPASSAREGMVIQAGAGPLVVRTRRPGDRVRLARGEVSLKRFLLQRRVPVDERESLPLVASGRRVIWIAGLSLPAFRGEGGRFVRLQLVGGPLRERTRRRRAASAAYRAPERAARPAWER